MRSLIVALLLVTVGCADESYDEHRVSVVRKTSTYTGQQFEYKITTGMDINQLDEVGADGWEMTGVSSDVVNGLGCCIKMYFKRPLVKSK